jgi:hypothetical protein
MGEEREREGVEDCRDENENNDSLAVQKRRRRRHGEV